MLLAEPLPTAAPPRVAIRALTRADETDCVGRLLPLARIEGADRTRVDDLARRLVQAVRAAKPGAGLEAFLHEYALSSQEGVILMCLAEALLRIPDAATADRLIRDKLAAGDWRRHLGHSESILVNATTWSLMLTGRVVRLERSAVNDVGEWLSRLAARTGEPLIREATKEAMRIIGRQFVMGQTIGEALARAAPAEANGVRHSYDMLGEAARTMADAERYYAAYADAIAAIGRAAPAGSTMQRPGISVKLSALHPRYEFAKRTRVLAELLPRLTALAQAAAEHNLGFCVDAEEADRLELSLDLIEAVALDPRLRGWDGFGLAVQAYQKRALAAIDWLADLARRASRRLAVRLVKGAYWDSEIKRAQEGGFPGYPVFSRKAATDMSYLACARRLLAEPQAFYPQFATHNAHTVAAVTVLANEGPYEFQRLHGMGEALYGPAAQAAGLSAPCRVYAPVGGHEDLLAYLVRRLLENGANTSFVNRIVDATLPVERIIADPADEVTALTTIPHPRIPLPVNLFQPERLNSTGIDLADPTVVAPLSAEIAKTWSDGHAAPLVDGVPQAGPALERFDPADRRRRIGTAVEADADAVERALASAARAAPDWNAMPAEQRATILERAADLFEADRGRLLGLLIREAGKCVPDAVAELREAVDYCRYYAARARADFSTPRPLPGPTGERNELTLTGRGVFACISPWNFPLAIFTGQVTAALAAGNAAIAKPAEPTPLVAMHAIELLHRAGVPAPVLQFLPGRGETVGARLVADSRIDGVVFTGGTDTAQRIARGLAARNGPIVPLIAETGGQNAMIVDSSALPEQVVADVIRSAFNSAGQRCSALRVLFLQSEIAERVITMLKGAMTELGVGDPARLETDVGPVINAAALKSLAAHVERMAREGRPLAESGISPDGAPGCFFAPRAFEIDRIERLTHEVFGPILHVVRFAGDRLDQVVDSINDTGYGLTLGVHSRIDETVRRVRARARAGNLYINRNMIGAVVGVQPFGGEGLSGTGPKAGGPHYLHRFALERSVAIDTTAAGGNAALLTLGEG